MSEKRDIDKHIVFGVSPTSDGKGPVITLGVTEKAWDYMRDGLTHTFDLSSIGIPIRIIIMRGADHDSIMREIEGAMKAAGVPILDERRKDFGI